MRQIDLEREIACDDFVVASVQCPWTYANCLTRVVELNGNVRGSIVGAMAVNGLSHLERRINLLLDGTRRTHTRLRKARLGAIVAVLALFGWFGGRVPGVLSFAMAQAAQVATPAPTTPTAVQASQAATPQSAKPPAAPSTPARLLDPGEDPERRALVPAFGEKYRSDEDPDVKAFGGVFNQLLQTYRSFNGTAAQQDAAITAQLTRFRVLVDQLTAARLKEETRE